jgi:hypothetical protein
MRQQRLGGGFGGAYVREIGGTPTNEQVLLRPAERHGERSAKAAMNAVQILMQPGTGEDPSGQHGHGSAQSVEWSTH